MTIELPDENHFGEVLIPENLELLIGTALIGMVTSFTTNDPIATERLDVDTLHDARVPHYENFARVFGLFARCSTLVGQPAFVRMSWFANLMGDVRQIDIVAEHLSVHGAWADDQLGAQSIAARIDHERELALERLTTEGRSERYGVVIRHLDTIRSHPPFTTKALASSEAALPRLLTTPWREVRGAWRVAKPATDETALHTLRIRAKELRYAADVSRRVLGKPVVQVAKAAAVMQDRLGDHRDAIFTSSYLVELGIDDARGAFLAGQLVVLERALGEATLDDLGSTFRNLRTRWRRVERTF